MAFYARNSKPLTPAEDAVVPLGNKGTISGVVFNDLNGDGIQDPGELGLKHRIVFLDTNPNGVLDDGELFAETRSDGSYTIKRVPAGDYTIVETIPKGWHATYPFVEGDMYVAETAKYKFVEISKTGGQMVFGDIDDGYAFLESNRGATFYGQSYTDISISVNGFLTFASNPSEIGAVNQQLPDLAAPNNLIAPLWDDFVLGAKGKVYALDDDLNGRIVIEWKNVVRFDDVSGPKYTFEAILYDDGRIKFMYKDVPPGGTATVGVENQAGTEATQISYNGTIDPLTGYELTPVDILFGRTTIHVDPGAVLTGIDFAQTKNVNASVFGADTSLGLHAAGHALSLDHGAALHANTLVQLA